MTDRYAYLMWDRHGAETTARLVAVGSAGDTRLLAVALVPDSRATVAGDALARVAEAHGIELRAREGQRCRG